MLLNDTVVIKLGDLFLQYEVAKEYNIDNPYGGRVSITYAQGMEVVSRVQALMLPGETFVYQYVDGNSTARGNATMDGFSIVNRTYLPNVIIQVCDMMTGPFDFATINIYVDDGIPVSQCPETMHVPGFSPVIPSSNGVPSLPRPFNNGNQMPEGYYNNSMKVENNKSPVISSQKQMITLGFIWFLVGALLVIACLLSYKFYSLEMQRAAHRNGNNAVNTLTERENEKDDVRDHPSEVQIQEVKTTMIESWSSFGSDDI